MKSADYKGVEWSPATVTWLAPCHPSNCSPVGISSGKPSLPPPPRPIRSPGEAQSIRFPSSHLALQEFQVHFWLTG